MTQTDVATAARNEAAQPVQVRVVDSDVHPAPKSPEEVTAYLPEEYQSQRWPQVFAPGTATASPMYLPPGGAYRLDAESEFGGPGSDPDLTARQLFGEARVDYAVLLPLGARAMASPEHEAAVCHAVNSWMANTWLTRDNTDGRFRGSIRIPTNAIDTGVEQIERWGDHPMFSQVFFCPNMRAPLRAPAGQRIFYPLYEAASRHGLPIAMHPIGVPGDGSIMPMGTHSYFVEQQSLYSLIFAGHLTSMICSGAFDRFPDLKLVLVEGGFAWLGPLVNRLENLWDTAGAEVKHLQRRPSEYIRDQVRLTTQPIEEPGNRKHEKDMLEWMAADKVLMFSTDYPHWDGDYHPDLVLRELAPEARDAILYKNAMELYGLPAERPFDPVTDPLRAAV